MMKCARVGLAALMEAMALLGGHAAIAAAAFSCGGFALLGGAQLVCSNTDPAGRTQICTFSWALMRTGGAAAVIEGSFILVPRISNAMVYQGEGFSHALSSPIVLCQAGRSDP